MRKPLVMVEYQGDARSTLLYRSPPGDFHAESHAEASEVGQRFSRL